jgi:hypothetical protein
MFLDHIAMRLPLECRMLEYCVFRANLTAQRAVKDMYESNSSLKLCNLEQAELIDCRQLEAKLQAQQLQCMLW